MQYGGLNTPMDITACAASFVLRPLDLPRLPLCVLPSQGYAKIMQVLGSNVAAFLTNLNNLHLHMSMGWPSMKPPSFRVEEVCILRGGGGGAGNGGGRLGDRSGSEVWWALVWRGRRTWAPCMHDTSDMPGARLFRRPPRPSYNAGRVLRHPIRHAPSPPRHPAR